MSSIPGGMSSGSFNILLESLAVWEDPIRVLPSILHVSSACDLFLLLRSRLRRRRPALLYLGLLINDHHVVVVVFAVVLTPPIFHARRPQNFRLLLISSRCFSHSPLKPLLTWSRILDALFLLFCFARDNDWNKSCRVPRGLFTFFTVSSEK